VAVGSDGPPACQHWFTPIFAQLRCGPGFAGQDLRARQRLLLRALAACCIVRMPNATQAATSISFIADPP
jgi:hypothetical protein